MEIIIQNNDFDGYEEWLDSLNQTFFNNLDAELDAMAVFYGFED